jgi:hypothetical protein
LNRGRIQLACKKINRNGPMIKNSKNNANVFAMQKRLSITN